MKLQDLFELAAAVAIENLKFTRKPVKWSDIDTITEDELKQRKINVENITEYAAGQLWDAANPEPMDEFDDETFEPDIFVLTVKGKGTFLVKRDGYDYVRYALKIV